MASGDEATRGQLVLGGVIASGGHGSVHVGKIVGAGGFSRRVAVKRVRAGLADDPEVALMLLDDARLASRIHHPNVVSVHDVLRQDEDVLVVMELVRGVSVARLLERARERDEPVALPVAVAITIELLRGLHAAHEVKGKDGASLGLVHRDVSPHNVLVSDAGITRVIDFGVAKAEGRLQRTRQGQVKGKPAYMAPEQRAGGVVDRRADVYGAARVLETLLGLRDQAKEGQLRRTRAAPAFVGMVARAVATDPAARFATAKEFADALENTIPPARPRDVMEWFLPLVEADLAALDALVRAVEVGEGGGVGTQIVDIDSAELTGPALDVGVRASPTGPARGGTGPAPAARSRAPLAWLAAAAGVGALGAWATSSLWGVSAGAPALHAADVAVSQRPVEASAPTGSVAPASSAAEDPPPAVEPSAAPATGDPSATSAPVVAARPLVPGAGASGPSSATRTSPATASPSSAPPPRSCDPPYDVTPDGIRVPRRECLQ